MGKVTPAFKDSQPFLSKIVALPYSVCKEVILLVYWSISLKVDGDL